MDIKKAYDNASWDFLVQVMGRMGFGAKWIGLIHWCISTATFYVLINASLSGFFHSAKELRQGDPLSPYLFVIAMEAFSLLINKVAKGGFITG